MDTDLAYLAGAIDSDGFITIGTRTGYRRKSDGTVADYFVVKVGLSQTQPIIPDLLQSLFPAFRGSHQPKNPTHKKWYIWTASSQKAKQVLIHLLPYLRLKRGQAELALSYFDLVSKQNVSRSRSSLLTAEEQASRRAIYSAITLLNCPRNRRIHHLEMP